jgi:hypothetical protein
MKATHAPQSADKHDAPTKDTTRIDFSHPDIMRARANAYALILQWAAERDAQAKAPQNEQTAHQEEVNHEEKALDMSDILQTNQIEGPASASTETGLR